MKKNIDLSLKLKKARKPKKNSCFRNASSALAFFSLEYGYEDAQYVEGFILSENALIEHGWIECKDGIVDTTLPKNDQSTYYPVNKYTHEEMFLLIMKHNGATPLFLFNKKHSDKIDKKREQLLKQFPGSRCMSDDIPVYYRQ